MSSGKGSDAHGHGSALGAFATLSAAVVVAYLLPAGEDKKAGHAREPGFAPRGDSTGASAGEALERGRGRLASAPSEIPARGWKDILLRVYRNISDHRACLRLLQA
jgi:hypothetical protein